MILIYLSWIIYAENRDYIKYFYIKESNARKFIYKALVKTIINVFSELPIS